MATNDGHKAQAVMIGERYFCKFGKGGRVMTAWSLAGAQLFLSSGEVEKVCDKLVMKNKQPVIIGVVTKNPFKGEVPNGCLDGFNDSSRFSEAVFQAIRDSDLELAKQLLDEHFDSQTPF